MPSTKIKVRELRFPLQGVVRRRGHEDSASFQEPYPSPWSVNVRAEDYLAKRLRGGSRSGLTMVMDDLEGSSIAGMLSVTTSSTSSVETKLVVLADDRVGYLWDRKLQCSRREFNDRGWRCFADGNRCSYFGQQ